MHILSNPSAKLTGFRGFVALWLSQSLSTLGSSMTTYALLLWTYQQVGTASSLAWLSVCSYLPSILFCFAAGTLADRWDKKSVMLVADLVAALGTTMVFILYATGALRVWHLYLVNALVSLMNAFQNPAANVAVSLLAPRQHYTRVTGMQVFANSLVTILSPALATAILSFAGIRTVFVIDLTTFGVAFLVLWLFIRVPPVPRGEETTKQPFLQACGAGLRFLRTKRGLLKLILFFSFVNLLASLAGNAIMPAMILYRTGDNQTALGLVSSAIGVGMLAGSAVVTFLRPAKRKTVLILVCCGLSFLLCDVLWALGRSVPVWVFAAFAGNFPLPFLNANLTTIMRTRVPLEMQGRVFAARDTLQFFTIPLGLSVGGFLADGIFEPFMLGGSRLAQALVPLVGSGRGAGMALIFLITGTVGTVSCFLCLRSRDIAALNDETDG